MSRHGRSLAFLGGFLWLACATRSPTDVAPASPSASPAVAYSGSCFRGNMNYGDLMISISARSDAAVSSSLSRTAISQEDVNLAVEGYMHLVRKCYQAANFHSPNLEGQFTTIVTVAADGTVSDSWILRGGTGSTSGEAEMEECIGRALCAVVFPRPKGNASTVVYQTFQFGKGIIGHDLCYQGHFPESPSLSAPPRPSLPAAPDAGVPDGSSPALRGCLDLEVIRGVIRSQIPAVRACYERGLSGNLDLKGRITCQFTIAADGSVIASGIRSSTMADAKVENCVCQEIRNWRFPKPLGGGIVIVSYPFTFTSGR